MRYFDQYWSDALEHAKRVSGIHARMIVPHEVLSDIENSVPYGFTFSTDPEDIACVVVHKGRLDDLSISFVERLLKTHHYSYGNPVFSVFSKSSDDKGAPEHRADLEKWLSKRKENISQHREARERRRASSSQSKKYQKILIISANNFGNVGDDAITHAAENIMRSACPEADIRVEAPAVARELIEETDLMVLGGGGLFYDGRIDNAINYTNYIFFAKEAGVDQCSIGIGTQGIRTPVGTHLFQTALNYSTFTVVRDPKDKSVLEEIGVSSPVILTQDIVFSLPAPEKEGSPFKSDGKPVVGIALLDSRNLLASRHMQEYQQGVFDAVEDLSRHFHVAYICQSLDDINLYRDLKKKFGGEIVKISYDGALAAQKYYYHMDLCVTSRFHGLIFAVKAGTPVISVGTNGSKTDRLIRNFVPSIKDAHIPLRDFNRSTFGAKLSLYDQDKMRFVADRSEVSDCVEEARRTIAVVKEHLC